MHGGENFSAARFFFCALLCPREGSRAFRHGRAYAKARRKQAGYVCGSPPRRRKSRAVSLHESRFREGNGREASFHPRAGWMPHGGTGGQRAVFPARGACRRLRAGRRGACAMGDLSGRACARPDSFLRPPQHHVSLRAACSGCYSASSSISFFRSRPSQQA